MDCKAGLLFFIILLIGSFAPEDDMSIFFDHTDANARIIGGTEVAAGTHPHMVALIVGVSVKNFICGGSLLTQRTVLTAAHCVDNVYGINWVIRVLITASNVVLNSLVQPVALTYEHIDAGVPSIVAGWGVTKGDSGSALRRADNGKQFGIASWGFLCALGHPDVFVRISAYESWLKTVIV
ncbi:hypothetical protein HF086_018187 [Spodoptera exigua]|uniref:Peptidase S1 domain-containing protein n=1 Tax=Spodoptera exigua TaxID=7107 RepID=A0A922MLM0_SPOEX|nr:hypothetical protein HF086_018187 [Spodoptera exigua]